MRVTIHHHDMGPEGFARARGSPVRKGHTNLVNVSCMQHVQHFSDFYSLFFSMDFHDLSSPMRPAYALPVLACLVLAVQLFLRISSSYARLRKFPGPMLASVSNLWLLNKFWRREPWPVTSVALHKQYGPVVRYGPNRLMFSDVAATHTILATSNVFEKVGDSEDATAPLLLILRTGGKL